MKKAKIIFATLAFVCVLFFYPHFGERAKAVDLPYVVVGKDLWLLEKTNGQRLFLLPESYYARIDNIDDTFYYITFNGVSGKVEKELASTIGYHTEADGTMQELRIDSRYSIFTEIKLKSSMEGSSVDIPVPVDGSLIFIGKYALSEDWYYVKYDNSYGYIKAEFTNKPKLEINTFIPKVKPAEITEEPVGESEEPMEGKLVKILIITGLSVVLMIILICLRSPGRKNKRRFYYEE